MASLHDVTVKVIPEIDTDALRVIEGDLVEKVNAGAALTYALYHVSKEVILALPPTVTDALVRAQHAYRVNSHHREGSAAPDASPAGV